MITSHKFMPAPYYPDRCDAYTEGGKQYGIRCHQRGRDHASCCASEGHVSEAIHETNCTGQDYARCKECLLYLGALEAKAPPPPVVAREAAVIETARAVDMRCEPYQQAIRESLKLLRAGASGGLTARLTRILSAVDPDLKAK
jgi:hypothetical protein